MKIPSLAAGRFIRSSRQRPNAGRILDGEKVGDIKPSLLQRQQHTGPTKDAPAAFVTDAYAPSLTAEQQARMFAIRVCRN